MQEVPVDMFLGRLKRDNKGAHALKSYTKFRQREGIKIFRKSREIVECIDYLCRAGLYPIVDKRFGYIFGLADGFHELYRGHLYCYHEEETGWIVGEYNGARRYLTEGLGYYLSSMAPDTVIVGQTYQADRYDKDLFLIKKPLRYS